VFAFVLSLTFPTADPSDDTMTLARQACVRITETASGRSGSGAIVGRRDGSIYILTAAHVIAKAKEIRVVPFPASDYPKPDKTLNDAIVLIESAGPDLALIRVPDRELKLTPMSFAIKTEAAGAFTGIAVGCDAAGIPDARSEKIAGKRLLKRKNGDSVFAWETEKRPDHGRSGGPLLDEQGRLLGICLGTQDDKGYYCHTDEIRAVLKARGYDWIWKNSTKER
jgi:S1-C subfamily serine protease